MTPSQTLLVCGLDREGRLAAGPSTIVVPSGGRRTRLAARLKALDPARLDAVVSFGLAGALEPALAVGDVVISGAPQDEEGRSLRPDSRHDGALRNALRDRLATLGLRTVEGPILGVDAPVTSAEAKASLRAASGAVAVDMESHVAAAFATEHRLPFAVVRVISDGADQAIPPAAIAAMREDGGIDVAAVLRSLVRDPRQIPALIRTARDGARAFAVLGRVGGLLRLGLGLHLR